MSALGSEWDAVFREPVDEARFPQVARLLGRKRELWAWSPPVLPPRWAWSSPVLLQAANLGDDAVADALQGLGRDEADQGQELGLAGRIDLVFRRHDAGQAVDCAAQLVVVQVLQLVRQQDDQHVLVRGQYAGDLGIGVHSCCAPPSSDGVVALARVDADRNRSAIFSRDPVDAARTAFAARARLSEIELRHAVLQAAFAASIRLPWWIRLHDWLYRTLTRAGDLVARLGARISRGVA